MFSSSLSNAARSVARVKNDVDKGKRRMVVPRLFECSNEGCLRSFFKVGNLPAHLVIGDHRRRIEKRSLVDTAKKDYQSKLVGMEKRRMISFSLEQTSFDPRDYQEVAELKEGWALQIPRKPVRLTLKQKQYLNVSQQIV